MRIERTSYLNQLIASQNNGLIKIITGIRRCGKSYLLFNIFYDYLISQGIDNNHIIKIALDDVLNEEYQHLRKLVMYVKERITDNKNYYVFIDEVQMMDNFVGALNSLLHIENADVYVTGSNSKFLSSDIATEFRGRGDVIHIYPLSFKEFYSVYEGNINSAWKEYSIYGGLPLIRNLDTNQKKISYLSNLYKTVYIKDLVERNKIRKHSEFEKLIKISTSSIGAPCNPNKLSNTFKSVENVNLNPETISFYLSYLQDAYLIEKSTRYDIKGKKYIGSLSKYYFTDIGLRNAILNFRQQEESHIMENIIYNELCIKGFAVDVGIVEHRTTDKDNQTIRKQYEVDFVANLGSQRYYIQSALSIPDKGKIMQETNSLRHINDNFRKIVITKDDVHPWHNEEGILFVGLFDFLLKDEIDL
mgnify:FL=1